MQLFSVDAKMFLKENLSCFFAHKKLKKPPSKLAQKNLNPLFSYCPDCPNSPNIRIFVPKCGFKPTLYGTGLSTKNDTRLGGHIRGCKIAKLQKAHLAGY